MQRFEQRQRRFEGRRPGLGEARPAVLVIGTNGGLVLGQRQLAAGVGVEMAVRHVMDELADRPAVRPVGSFELGRGEPRHRLAQPGRGLGKRRDGGGALLLGEAFGAAETSDRIAQVWGLGHGADHT